MKIPFNPLKLVAKVLKLFCIGVKDGVSALLVLDIAIVVLQAVIEIIDVGAAV